MNTRSLISIVFPLLLSVASFACSSSDSTPQGGAGGSGTGGGASTGGKTGSGGAGTGGVMGSGGAGSGGTIGSGGAGSGGTAGKGGATSAGGNPGTGGSTAGATADAGARGGNTGGATSGSGGGTVDGGSGGAGPGSGGRIGPDAGATGGGGGGTSVGTGGTRVDGGPEVSGPETGGGFNPCPTTAGTACAIMPLGDSITEGFGATGNVGGYRIELFRQAVTDGKNINFVGSATNGPTTVANKTFPRKHEGHGGWTISQISGIVAPTGGTASVLTTYKPNIVLLMIGTNDINGNMDVSNAPSRLESLINQITSNVPSALVVVASIIPSQNDGTNRNFQTYNAAIPGVISKASAAGKHVVYLDNWAAFSADSSYKTKLMTDNLHPNDAGYVVLGQSWYKAIGSYLPAAH